MNPDFQFEHDVALSYAFSRGDEHELSLIETVCSSLRDAGVRLFLIQEDEAPKTKRWARRYYEALFRSRFFVPVLSRQYLTGTGARMELAAIAELVSLRRSSGFFYPLVPIVANVDYLKHDAMRDAARLGNIEASTFEWLKTHSFPVLLDWGDASVSAFFRSLVRGAQGDNNLDWLRLLSPQICAIRFEEHFGRASVLVQLRNPLFTHNFEFRIGVGGVRYGGCLFEPEEVLVTFDRGTIVDRIEEHLHAATDGGAIARCRLCRFRQVWREESMLRCLICSGAVEQVEDYLCEPQGHEAYLCEICGHVGIPAGYEIGAECPRCGGQMSNRVGESVKRLLLKKFGTEV